MPRSPKLLIYAGLLGLLFFWLTDPRFGVIALTAGENARDAANIARVGSLVGVAGSVYVLLVGTYLWMRRAS